MSEFTPEAQAALYEICQNDGWREESFKEIFEKYNLAEYGDLYFHGQEIVTFLQDRTVAIDLNNGNVLYKGF